MKKEKKKGYKAVIYEVVCELFMYSFKILINRNNYLSKD